MVYKLHPHPALGYKSYTRHSHLGSGKPVICAGTFEIDAASLASGISTVIVARE